MVGVEPLLTLSVTPIPKPRMTQSDRWKKRGCVLRYYDFKDRLKEEWGGNPLPETFWIVCYLPMPKSWSKKKKAEMQGTPHKQKPDADNLTKAFKDALYPEDSYVWDERCTKLWADEGRIEVYSLG